jgi:molecular chaperone GrpE
VEEVANAAPATGFQPPAQPGDDRQTVAVEAADVESVDYKDRFLRAQADLANFRKQTMKRAADDLARAKGQLITRLLPVLDNFERAIAHGEGGDGVALVFRQLIEILQAEGVEEVPGKGSPVDYTMHEAVQSHEDPSVEVETVSEVHRRGYRIGDTLLRPAMVVVARPAAEQPSAEATAPSGEEV